MSRKNLCRFILGFACLVAIPQRFLWAQGDAASTGTPVLAGSRTISPGTTVQAQYTNNPPTLTPGQARELEALWSKANRTGPMEPIHPAPMTTAAERGAEAASPRTPIPNSFSIYRDSVIPASAIAGGYGFSSYTMEPSSGINGRYAFQTGNWYASRFDQNLNAGAGGWTFLNPFTLFGSGFCCDQVTTYLADWNREYWLLQFGDHLVLANSAGANLNSWCYYNINASWWGLDPTQYSIDYNDMAFSKNYVYVASNIFGPGVAFGAILRLPISKLSSCAAFSYNFYYDTTRFTFKPVQGATNVMYWGSNWGGGLNGSGFRVYSWAENSATIFFFNRTVTAFNYEYRNNGQFCGSADGVVTSWCNFNDSRVKGGYRANGVIGFSYDVTQGSGYPFPYIRREYFRESDLAYLGNAQFWASFGAFQYGTFAPNNNGDIGGAFSWGGGTGTTHYYPGTGYLIDDDFSPTQPWSYVYQIFGGGNTCTYGGIPRWGDYLTTRPDYPAGYAWVGTGWAIKGGNCGAAGAFSEPHNVVFGRGRDISDIGRWKNK